MTDYIVRTGDAELLNETLEQLPMIRGHVLDGSWDPTERTCKVRVEGDTGFFVFAMEQQGYGEVIGEVR